MKRVFCYGIVLTCLVLSGVFLFQPTETDASGVPARPSFAEFWGGFFRQVGGQFFIFGGAGQLTPTVIFLTSGTSWTVPSDWNSLDNTIEVIGAGGGGSSGSYGSMESCGKGCTTFVNGGYGYGGGGGAYSEISNLTLTPGASVAYQAGAGGAAGVPLLGAANDGGTGGDTFFNRTAGSAGTCADTVSVCAKGGTGGLISASTAGSGGASASGVGTTKFSGGGSISFGASGGAGAAGLHGAGNNVSSGTVVNGSSGDAGWGGTGGNATTGSHPGGNGTEYDSSHGSGGGGSENISENSSAGGGLYGGGGGAGLLDTGSGPGSGGAGAQGLIVITYYTIK